MYKNFKIVLVFLGLSVLTSTAGHHKSCFTNCFKKAYKQSGVVRVATGVIGGYSASTMISGLVKTLITSGRRGIFELFMGGCGVALTTYLPKSKFVFEDKGNSIETNCYTVGYILGVVSYPLGEFIV